MAQHSTQTATQTATINPQAAAQAALQAALANMAGANGAPSVSAVLGKLQPGKAYTLRQVAQLVGYSPRKRPNGKFTHAPLRRTMAQAVRQGKAVVATVGGYTGANGAPVGGTAYYMLVSAAQG